MDSQTGLIGLASLSRTFRTSTFPSSSGSRQVGGRTSFTSSRLCFCADRRAGIAIRSLRCGSQVLQFHLWWLHWIACVYVFSFCSSWEDAL